MTSQHFQDICRIKTNQTMLSTVNAAKSVEKKEREREIPHSFCKRQGTCVGLDLSVM